MEDNNKDFEQLESWCSVLKVTPSKLLSMSEDELQLKLDRIKNKLRRKVAKCLQKYRNENNLVQKNLKDSKNYSTLERVTAGGNGQNIWDILCQAAEDVEEIYGMQDESSFDPYVTSTPQRAAIRKQFQYTRTISEDSLEERDVSVTMEETPSGQEVRITSKTYITNDKSGRSGDRNRTYNRSLKPNRTYATMDRPPNRTYATVDRTQNRTYAIPNRTYATPTKYETSTYHPPTFEEICAMRKFNASRPSGNRTYDLSRIGNRTYARTPQNRTYATQGYTRNINAPTSPLNRTVAYNNFINDVGLSSTARNASSQRDQTYTRHRTGSMQYSTTPIRTIPRRLQYSSTDSPRPRERGSF